MVEPIMFFGLGFLAASLLGLVIVPFVHGRAVRLTVRRLEAATPLSMEEIQADKDQLRAEFAMSTRRLEMSVEQLKNKTTSQLADSDMNIIVAGSRDAIVMVEGGAHMLSEAIVLEAMFTAHEALQPLIALQDGLQRAVGKTKRTVTPPVVDAQLERQVRELGLPKLQAALATPGKHERYAALDAAKEAVVSALTAAAPERALTPPGILGSARVRSAWRASRSLPRR